MTNKPTGDLSIREIAEIQGKHYRTVQDGYLDAMRKLREEFADCEPDDYLPEPTRCYVMGRMNGRKILKLR